VVILSATFWTVSINLDCEFKFIMKKLIYFFLFVFFIFLSPINANAQEVIQDFSAKIIINQDGTINVTEKILYDFSTFQKHGIYRNIFFTKKNEEGKKYQLDFSNFLVKDENGNNYDFSQSIVNEEIRLKIGDADKFITGMQTYIISYKVTGALTYFLDHDELYWNVTGNKWCQY